MGVSLIHFHKYDLKLKTVRAWRPSPVSMQCWSASGSLTKNLKCLENRTHFYKIQSCKLKKKEDNYDETVKYVSIFFF